jgi:3-oxoacyl-[acyl-carrier protein] reductase
MDLDLSGKVAVVAGASAGIGKAIAGSLSREGASVVILSRSKSNLTRAAKEISAVSGNPVLPIVCDVTRKAAINSAVTKVVKKFGRVDILVNNAGGPPLRRFLDLKDADWDDAYSLSLKSAIMLSAAVVPHMKARKWGRIISVTSITALQASETLLLSSVMRPGVHGLTKGLSNELAQFGITANVICPGYTRTERLEELAEATRKATGTPIKQVYAGWEQVIPARRLGRPEEIGDLAAFLASERAGYINGVAINIDGGYIKAI